MASGAQPASQLSVLGADRFRRMSHRSPEKRSARKPGRAVAGAAFAGPSDPPKTPHQRPTVGESTTGPRPTPPDAAKAEGGAGPRGGLLALSLRLSGAQLQQSLRQAAEERAVKPAAAMEPRHEQDPARLPLSERGRAFGEALRQGDGHLVPGAAGAQPEAPGAESSGQGPGLGMLARSKAFGEALGKKAKASHPPAGGAPMEVDSGAVADGGGFQRGQLTGWMELTVQNAPPSRPHVRALPGGLQDGYVRAVRHHLTEASLVAQGARASSDIAASAIVSVQWVHEGPEGLLVSCVVLRAPEALAGQGAAVGSCARLLLHRRHSFLQCHSEGWLPAPGSRLRLGSCTVVSAGGAGGRGPLLLPLELQAEGPGF